MKKKLLGVGKSSAIVLIFLYLLFGLFEQIFAPDDEEFYSNFYREFDEYELYSMKSINFDLRKDKLSSDFIVEIKKCLKKEPRRIINLGENKNDKFVYLSLVSSEYKYDLAFKWRIDNGTAYITGVERKTSLNDSETTEKGGFGVIGGNCFGKVLSDMGF